MRNDRFGSIEWCIKQLIAKLGLRKDISRKSLREMQALFDLEEYTKCIGKIKSFFSLGFSLRVGYVKEQNNPFGSSLFGSDIVEELLGNPKGDKRAPAWITIPEDLPLYGSKAFDSMQLTMHIRPSVIRAGFYSFIYVVAHEMLHVVLQATKNSLRENEIATDLAIMTLGFARVAKLSREDDRHKYGYLNDREIGFAYHQVRSMQSNLCERIFHRVVLLFY